MLKLCTSLLAAALFALLSGCGILQEASDAAAEKIGEGVTYYCDNVMPEIREQFRRDVNHYAAPNAVEVTCAGDGEVLSTEPTAATLRREDPGHVGARDAARFDQPDPSANSGVDRFKLSQQFTALAARIDTIIEIAINGSTETEDSS